jgi:hypothetical protein
MELDALYSEVLVDEVYLCWLQPELVSSLLARSPHSVTTRLVFRRMDSELAKLRLLAPPCLSVCLFECNNSNAANRIFVKFNI